MPTFNYFARNQETAQEHKGLVEAASLSAAATLLRNQRLIVTKLVEKKEDEWSLEVLGKKLRGVSSKDLFAFTREFSTMVSSGLPITGALRILSAQSGSSYFKEILGSIIRDVEGGIPLSKALEKYPQVFNVIYVNLVKSGELSGTLDKVLERLAANLDKERELKGKVKGALIYPIIVVLMMVGVMVVILVFVIPKLTEMYSSMGVDLPLPTKIMVWTSNFLVNDWWLATILTVSAVAGFRYYKKTAVGRRQIDVLSFKIPVFGNLMKISQLAEFTRDLGVLVGSGIPIIDALKASKESLRNSLLQDTIDKAISSVGRGQPLSQIIAGDPGFPAIIPQMLKVGEETGRVDKVLLDVSKYFESETDYAVKNLSAAIEPIIMVVLGGGVGLLILSIITPIYKLTSSF
jgi:type IV pilus assembly protein PilC